MKSQNGISPANWKISRQQRLRIAPFLSANGYPMLVHIDPVGALWLLTEIEQSSSVMWWRDGQESRIECSQKYYAREGLRMAHVGLWPEGIHVAPWRAADGKRPVFVAIDERHRMVGHCTASGTDDASHAAARADLELFLAIAGS